VARTDINCGDLIDTLSRTKQWGECKNDLAAILKETGKEDCLKGLAAPSPASPGNPYHIFYSGRPNRMHYKVRRAFPPAASPEAMSTPAPATPEPTPYPLDPVYLQNDDMRTEGLTRAFLAQKDPAVQEAILSQMNLANLGSLQPFLLNQFMDRLQNGAPLPLVLEFLTGFSPGYRWNHPGFGKWVIQLPFDSDPEVRLAKVTALMRLRDPDGPGYILKAVNSALPQDRRVLVETLRNFPNWGNDQDPAQKAFKTGILEDFLALLRTEKDPAARVALMDYLNQYYKDRPETAAAIKAMYSQAQDISEAEAGAVASFKDPELIPLLLALAQYPSATDRAIQTLSSFKSPETNKLLIQRLINGPDPGMIHWKKLDPRAEEQIRQDFGIASVQGMVDEKIKEIPFEEKRIILSALRSDPDSLDDAGVKACLRALIDAPSLRMANGLGNILQSFSNRKLYDGVEDYCRSHPDWPWVGTGVCIVARGKADDPKDVAFLKEFLANNQKWAVYCAQEGLKKRGETKPNSSPEPAAQ
jgi:hypothetical protein